MRRRLKRFLWVTGIASAVVAVFPFLVILATFALVVPGLVLMALPTAFLWGVAFAVFFHPLEKRVGEWPAALAAAVVTAALLFTLPTPGQWAASSSYERNLQPDIVPSAPLRPHGDVRLDYRYAGRSNGPPPRLADGTHALTCDGLCVALLLAPGVESVTVNLSSNTSPEHGAAREEALSERAYTYRLRPKAQCPDGNVAGVGFAPDSSLVAGLSREHREAIEPAWRLILSTERCIAGETPIDQADFLFREWRRSDPPDPSFIDRLLGASSARVEGFEILDREGRQLAHRRHVLATARARPLHFTFIFNSGVPEAGFRWAPKAYQNRKPHDGPLRLNEAVAAYTDLAATLPPAPEITESVEVLREALATALADRSRSANDPVFGMGPAYFQALMKAGQTDKDLTVARALIADGRVTSFPSDHHIRQVFGDDVGMFREAVIERAMSDAGDENRWLRRLNGTLAEVLPAGAFERLTREEENLLTDEQRRVRAPGLIYRLYDQGEAAVPRLVAILEHHLRARCTAPKKELGPERAARVRAAERGIAAARGALCRLGEDGAAALPALEAWFDEGFMPAKIADSGQWKRLAFRLGAPLESIEFRDDKQRDQFRERSGRFEPEQHCTWLDF